MWLSSVPLFLFKIEMRIEERDDRSEHIKIIIIMR